MMLRPRHLLWMALGLMLATGVFLAWLHPAVARWVMAASIGAWCS